MATTLLITTNGRTGQLRHSLARLCELTIPEEVLIIDDGGNDGCGEMVREFEGRLPVRYIYNNNPGQTICSLARNIGVKRAMHDWIVTSEPELMFVTDVIAQYRMLWSDNPNDVISAGTVYHAQSEGIHDPGACLRIEGWVAPFTAMYKREWLLDIGGWDESFPDPWGWDDTDLLTRLRCVGHGQVIERSIEVLHQWHPSAACNQARNEAHFLAKDLQNSTAHIMANPSGWGELR